MRSDDSFNTMFNIVFVLVVFGIIMTIGLNIYGVMTGNSTVSFGVNGTTEMRCIEGYKFTIDQRGRSVQVLDEFGKGLRCNSK